MEYVNNMIQRDCATAKKYITDFKSESFTKDVFKCGICDTEKFSIEEYVAHMIVIEQCILVMQQSSTLTDLMLPRFKRKKVISELTCEGKDLPLGDLNLASMKAVEVETGHGTRWKCRMCCLTFSRHAAVVNHYKLEHHTKEEKTSEDVKVISIKNEPKEITTIPLLPVVPISSLDSKDNLEHIGVKDIKKSDSQPFCHLCGQVFKSSKILSCHIGIVHSDKRPFLCKMDGCNLTFKTKGSLVRHTRRHTGARPYECLLCGRKYRESGSLLRHNQSRIPCVIKTNNHLPRYGLTLPFRGSNIENKDECKFQLKKEDLNTCSTKEIEDLDESDEKETKAMVRKQILASKFQDQRTAAAPPPLPLPEKKPLLNLKDIKKEHIGNVKKEHVSYDSCEDQKGSRKLDEAKPADETVAPSQEIGILRRTFTCSVCYRSYGRLSSLSNHMKGHLVDLGNECSVCFKKFNSQHALARHLMSHSSVRQFECCECGKSFKLKSHAQSHLKSHSNLKSIPCVECGRLFKSVSSRNNHMKIHIGEKNFECSLCFKKFLVKASYVRHLRVHTEEKPFQCPYCKQRFKEQGTLKKHIKNKLHCSQLHASLKEKISENELGKKNILKESFEKTEGSPETQIEVNDAFSETGSELGSYLSEKFDLSSIYSEHSDLSFGPEDYVLPHFSDFESLPQVDIKQECNKDVTEVL